LYCCYYNFINFTKRFTTIQNPVSGTISQPSEKNDRISAIRRIDIPVYWQMTRSRFDPLSAATQTESFREVWTLEIRPDGKSSLISPRSRINVLSGNTAGLDQTTALPKILAMNQKEFAKLLGIYASDVSKELLKDNDDRIIAINLSEVPKNGEDVTLYVSEDEYFEVHLEVGK